MSVNKMAYSILFNICIILTLFTMEVKTESGSGGDEDDAPYDYEDYESGVDPDEDYAKFVTIALLFVVILGPPVVYYYAHFYTKRQVGFLRVVSLFYWVIFWILMPFMLTCTSSRSCGPYSKTQHISDLLGFILMPIFWILFQIESWTSHERFRIAKLGVTETVLKYIDRLKNEQPSIAWSAKCFHYETRFRKVSFTDQEDQTQHKQEPFREKVVTHQETQEFKFGYWRDDSAQMIEGIGKCGIARIRLGKEVLCGDEDTAHLMNRLKQEFKERNRERDKYMDFSEEKNIPGFEATFTAYTDESCRSCWIGEPQFWIASLLALTWPYRWILRYKIDRAFFTVKKKLYNSRPEGVDVRVHREPIVEHTDIEIDTDSFSALPIDIHM